MSAHTAQWDAFRAEASKQDELLEGKLAQMEKLALEPAHHAQFERLHRDAQAGLAALQRVVQSMADLPAREPGFALQAKRWEDVCH